MKIGSIHSEEFTLEYVIRGEGEFTLLVIGSAIYYPRTFPSNLYKNFKFVFLDHRGFAKCAKTYTKADFTFDKVLNDIEQARQKLNLGEVVILGHSGHGYMALEYAKQYSEFVSKVVLIATGPSQSSEYIQLAEEYFNTHASAQRKQAQTRSIKTLESELQAEPSKRFITFCIKLGPRSWYDYNFDASSLWKNVNVNMLAFDYLWDEVFRSIDITQNLENFDIPILVVLGKHDYLVAPYYTWDSVCKRFTNIQIKVFSKSSHSPQMEEPHEFERALIDFARLG